MSALLQDIWQAKHDRFLDNGILFLEKFLKRDNVLEPHPVEKSLTKFKIKGREIYSKTTYHVITSIIMMK